MIGRALGPTVACVAAVVMVFARALPAARATAPAEGVVRVAMLSYAGGKTSRCFAPRFLSLLAHRTGIRVEEAFTTVEIGSPELFDHPFCVMTGEGAFTLSATELENVRTYLENGGLLLMSSGCSSPDWNVSARRAIQQLFPEQSLAELTPEHAVFHTVYDLGALTTRRRTAAHVMGVELDGRLAVVYSPEGLNDTEDAGGGCCCCGGNEISDAKYLNANILAYALMK